MRLRRGQECRVRLRAALEAAEAERDEARAERDEARVRGADAERAAIVAWLRLDQTCAGEPLRDLADAIEAGEHHD